MTCAERAEDFYTKYTLLLLSFLLSFLLKLCIVVACFKAFELRLKNKFEMLRNRIQYAGVTATFFLVMGNSFGFGRSQVGNL